LTFALLKNTALRNITFTNMILFDKKYRILRYFFQLNKNVKAMKMNLTFF